MTTTAATRNWIRRVRKSGFDAAVGGAERIDNPWRIGSTEHRVWREGWNRAAHDAGYGDNASVRTDYPEDQS